MFVIAKAGTSGHNGNISGFVGLSRGRENNSLHGLFEFAVVGERGIIADVEAVEKFL